ncbi:MAG: class I SAM-dependent methyltransferase [Candidatus Omnitrophota bacterium]
MKDKHADLYNTEERYWWSVIQRREALRFWKRFSKQGQERRILDVGCGAGALLVDLSGGAKVFGVDLSFKACHFSKTKKISVFQGDASRLPLRDNCFDAVFALDLIEHIEDELTCLGQIYRVCSREGICILTVPAWNCLWSERDKWLQHRRRYTAGQVRAAVEGAGFRVIRCAYIHGLLFPVLFFWSKIRRLFRYNKIKTDIVPVPKPLNLILIYLFSAEMKLFSRTGLPFGTSVICVAKKC